MTVLTANRIVSLLQENCKSRKSCVGCTMSGKHSLRDTCLLHELVVGKQATLDPSTETQLRNSVYHLFER